MPDSIRSPALNRRPAKPKVGDRWIKAGLGVVEKTADGLKVIRPVPGTKKTKASKQRKRSRERFQALTKGVPKRRG